MTTKRGRTRSEGKDGEGLTQGAHKFDSEKERTGREEHVVDKGDD